MARKESAHSARGRSSFSRQPGAGGRLRGHPLLLGRGAGQRRSRGARPRRGRHDGRLFRESRHARTPAIVHRTAQAAPRRRGPDRRPGDRERPPAVGPPAGASPEARYRQWWRR